METKGGFYIAQIKQLQDRVFNRLLDEEGIDITGSQGRILFILWKEDALSLTEISERASLAKNTVTVIVDRMVAKGVLQRDADLHDRRQAIISLTDKAKAMRDDYEKVSQRMNSLFYEGFTEDERQAFENYLARILGTLKDAENDQEKTCEEEDMRC
ncbi:MarR family winged helix-turn-helix transcriptional regulator [Adlercreutzia aquisgranensis]|uniref:MarR family transcriptional regulator n=1 Tax=Muribaculaceae bacterium Z82 TaxID=2304548 RepID=A0A7C9NAV6_9BACT|nr:MarR family transcriptional regulator [Adlercreutzia aquisgranensis]